MDIRHRDSASAPPSDDPSVPGARTFSNILRDVISSIQEMFRSEIELAKVELLETGRKVRGAGVILAGGGLLAVFALGFLLLTAMFGLEMVMPNWLAALILGLVLTVFAIVGISLGQRRFKEIHAPHKTLRTVKENLEWIQQQPRS